MAEYPREIPVTELVPGLTVWTIDARGDFAKDVFLADWHLGDYSPREFIIGHRLEFRTAGGQLVVWRNAGTVFVTDGNTKAHVIARKYKVNERQ